MELNLLYVCEIEEEFKISKLVKLAAIETSTSGQSSNKRCQWFSRLYISTKTKLKKSQKRKVLI